MGDEATGAQFVGALCATQEHQLVSAARSHTVGTDRSFR